MPEFWIRYTIARVDAARRWEHTPRTTEQEYRSFYAETDYWVLRQMYYHRFSSFHFIADALRPVKMSGSFCEYGAGVGPVTAWLRPRFPYCRYTLVDVPSPTLTFARWRFRSDLNVEFREPGLGSDLPLTGYYDAIACLEVLEHVINPLEVVHHLADHLMPGGSLFVNFVHESGGDENLTEAQAQRASTIDFLNQSLQGVTPLTVNGPDVLHGHYIKPRT